MESKNQEKTAQQINAQGQRIQEKNAQEKSAAENSVQEKNTQENHAVAKSVQEKSMQEKSAVENSVQEKIAQAKAAEERAAYDCIICDQTKSEGIRICSEFICDECEAEMVRTDVKDEKYPFFIYRMNKIWYKMNA